jgi:hypothetical protein
LIASNCFSKLDAAFAFVGLSVRIRSTLHYNGHFVSPGGVGIAVKASIGGKCTMLGLQVRSLRGIAPTELVSGARHPKETY